MNPLLIGGVLLVALVALYFLVFRPVKHRAQDGRSDENERPELTGAEQHKRREPL
ncbi:MAG TPA: hypothetical protein VHD62_14115 [Opitutaceae bacterium]|nr:hypothetical protein [Opitutaceae bacterium]